MELGQQTTSVTLTNFLDLVWTVCNMIFVFLTKGKKEKYCLAKSINIQEPMF